MYKLITVLIKGLKKSFDWKGYLKRINQCNNCGKPSFFDSCLKCEVDEAYRGYMKDEK